MKIRPSIRIYFLAAMLLTGSITITVMTGTAVGYFFSGMDMAMTKFFRSQAAEIPLAENNQPVQIDDLTVAAAWADLPQIIQDNLDPNELVPNQILKEIGGIPLFSPPEYGYFAMKVVGADKVRYVSLVLLDMDDDGLPDGQSEPPFLYIIFTGIGAIMFFAVILLLVQRKISAPVEQLRDWAKFLDKEQLTQPIPDFHYSELNSLAKMVQTSLSSVQEGLEREQRFLGYASHELRTPISVARTNSELLRKMVIKNISHDKQLEVLDRIERASLTMTDLTETLLWLNRQDDKSLPNQEICLGELVKEIEKDLTYLLHGKAVEVRVDVDSSRLELPVSLIRIVISNLVRNAFQHTVSGNVEIRQKGAMFTVINCNREDESSEPQELGFGLGLELTERLVHQYGWAYLMKPSSCGRTVSVTFE